MLPAALRFPTILVGAIFLATGLRAADGASPSRAAPTRPGAVPRATAPTPAPASAPLRTSAAKRVGGVDFVPVSDVAARLGLQVAALDKRRATLTGPGATRVELEAGEREATVNGLRIFLGEPAAESGGQLCVSRIDYERCLTPLVRPGAGVAARPKPRVIALDPGHGGRDNGKSNTALGVIEKTVALDTALRLKKLLEGAGFRVVLTRDDDTFVDLPQRAAIANIAKADVFVSIHFNALENDTRTSGIEVFTFPPQFQRSADSWGVGERPDRETEASPVNAFDHWSMVLAQPLHRELLEGLKASDRGKKLMHLKALRPLRCPGVLVECGFLTAPAEARKVATPAYRQQIAEALFAGLRAYAATVERAAAG
jgi:N-acetylmuramoyl-L-alanine amidase